MTITQRKGEVTRARILEAAFEAFSTFGYHGASLREIAAACGISHPGIRHHFASKEELLIEVLKERDARSQARAEEILRTRGFAMDAVTDIVEANINTPGLVELFVTMAAQAGNPEHPAHDYFSARYEAYRARYESYLEKARSEGMLHADTDVANAAIAIIGLMDGLQIQWVLQPNSVDFSAALDAGVRGIVGLRA